MLYNDIISVFSSKLTDLNLGFSILRILYYNLLFTLSEPSEQKVQVGLIVRKSEDIVTWMGFFVLEEKWQPSTRSVAGGRVV